jgi:hypothetical protein
MTAVAACVAVVAVALPSPDDALMDAAVARCRNLRGAPSRVQLRQYLDAEREVGVPPRLRGMVLAAACHESGFSPAAVGDGGRAVGLLQQHAPWYPDVDRLDPWQAARSWLERVAVTVRKARRCPRPWVAAWAWVAQGGRGYTCRESLHVAVLRKFRRAL